MEEQKDYPSPARPRTEEEISAALQAHLMASLSCRKPHFNIWVVALVLVFVGYHAYAFGKIAGADDVRAKLPPGCRQYLTNLEAQERWEQNVKTGPKAFQDKIEAEPPGRAK